MNMLLDQIDNFDIFRPKMDTTKEILHGLATFDTDISPAFPYVNAELGGWDYDQANQVLLLKLSDGKWFTLQPHEIAIKGARDIEEAHAMMTWIKGRSTRFMTAGKRSLPATPGRPGLRSWTS